MPNGMEGIFKVVSSLTWMLAGVLTGSVRLWTLTFNGLVLELPDGKACGINPDVTHICYVTVSVSFVTVYCDLRIPFLETLVKCNISLTR